jgi:hypothetical protein
MTLFGVVCAMLMLMLFSCSTTGYVWDETLSPEQSATVWFMYFTPKGYNGMDILKDKVYLATFPAGDAELLGDIHWSNQGYNVTYIFDKSDVTFSCKLEGGERYSAIAGARYSEEMQKRVWGIALYNEIPNIGWPKEENLVAFIPFDPLIVSND